ncbi:MAG: ABC transporter ATP-binding protein [Treponema sp.]|jgi:iron complex transport system ATP-binding protein|nr:ABC transporter ATP-binding protein [Treponema sp.]
MVKVENASFSYNGRDLVFEDLNFEVPQGEVMAILGANGIGKTTLFRCLMGFLKFRTGDVWIDGKNTRRMKASEFWRDLSYVPQGKGIIFDYPVLNMVVMGRSNNIGFGRMPKKEDYRAAFGVLEEMGLDTLADRPCTTLSGGQLQMVLIARALVKNPKILVMDEPESNLDMKNQLKTLDLIDTLAHKKNYTVLINTHFPAHALRCADKTLIIGPKGCLTGDTRQVVTQEHIEDYFGVRAKVLRFKDNAREFQGIIPFALKERASG